MELLATSLNNIAKIEDYLWTIEVLDLSTHQGFLGYLLSEKYMMVGITAPNYENHVSINSIPEAKEEIEFPLELEKCDSSKVGAIRFTGIDKLTANWVVTLCDNRFGLEMRVKPSEIIQIQQSLRNTRSTYLKLLERNTREDGCNSSFTLRLRRIEFDRN